jgi:hypothetical protein
MINKEEKEFIKMFLLSIFIGLLVLLITYMV